MVSTMRPACNVLASALVVLLFSYSAAGLCHDMRQACYEQGLDVFNSIVADNSSAKLFRHCQVMVTIVDCVEKAVCTCPEPVSAQTAQIFTEVFHEYYGQCQNTSGHTLRQKSKLECLGDTGVAADVPNNPERELEVDDTLQRAKIEELDVRLLRECPEYAHCSQVYNGVTSEALNIANPQQRLAALCQGNRFNLVCLTDAFCTCGEDQNKLIQDTMKSLRLTHERTCQEQFNEPLLQCTGKAPSLSAGIMSSALSAAILLILTL